VENKHHAWATQPTDVTWSKVIQRDFRSRLFQTHPQIQPNQRSSADDTTSSGSSGGSRRSRVAAPSLEVSAEREPLALPLLLAQVLQLTTTALSIAAAPVKLPVNYPSLSSGTDSASSSSRSLDPTFQRPDHTSREVWM
jgi:hypothetical protein